MVQQTLTFLFQSTIYSEDVHLPYLYKEGIENVPENCHLSQDKPDGIIFGMRRTAFGIPMLVFCPEEIPQKQLEWFSYECRMVIAFTFSLYIASLSDWSAKFAPITCNCFQMLWFRLVIVKSNCFGLGFTMTHLKTSPDRHKLPWLGLKCLIVVIPMQSIIIIKGILSHYHRTFKSSAIVIRICIS